VDGEHVYLRLGKAYFRGKGEGLIKVKTRSGEQVALCAPAIPCPAVSLAEPREWSLAVDDTRSGQIALAATAKGVSVTMETIATTLTAVDTWDLFFDLRPAPQRAGLYGRGTFMLRFPGPAKPGTALQLVPGPGTVQPRVQMRATTTDTGIRWDLLLPWTELERIAGRRPTGFGFAATLTLDAGDQELAHGQGAAKQVVAVNATVVQKHLFGDALAPAQNCGWANVSVSATPAANAAPAAAAP